MDTANTSKPDDLVEAPEIRADVDSGPDDGGVVCHALPQLGPVPTRERNEGIAQPTGGTIPDGVYYLVREGSLSGQFDEPLSRVTWRVSGDVISSTETKAYDGVTRFDTSEVERSSATSFIRTWTCSSEYAALPASTRVIGYSITDGVHLTVLFDPTHYGIFVRQTHHVDAGCGIVAPCD